MPAARNATAALAAGTRAALVELLVEDIAPQPDEDPRHVMMSLAPFYDCAQRLGLDTVDVFDAAAEQIDDVPLADLVRRFGRRSDVTLNVFGWVIEDGVYRFALRGPKGV